MKITIMRKEVDLDGSPILFEDPFSSPKCLESWKACTGEWSAANGWVSGKTRDNEPGMIVSKADYFGNVMVDFEARTVLPCTHDINFMWNGSWDEKVNRRDVAYVAGLQGWWTGKVGIEKSPEYKLNAGTPLFPFEPGRIYHIQGGSINGHCFVCVDGKLLLEVTDPDPIDVNRYGKVGFEAYCSHIQIRNVKVRQIRWTQLNPSYKPEF